MGRAGIFDRAGGFVVYLLERQMIKSARMLRGKGSLRRGWIARRWASFFYVPTLAFGPFAIAFFISCSGISRGAEKETLSTATVASTDPDAEPDPRSEVATPSRKDEGRRSIKSTGAELERVRSENDLLKEENSRLSSEVVRLNQALADANQEIYSLSRKLDAIFKPDTQGE